MTSVHKQLIRRFRRFNAANTKVRHGHDPELYGPPIHRTSP